MALFVGSWILAFPMMSASQIASTDLSDQLPEGEGKGYVETLCTSCHGLGLTVSQRMTPEGWEASVYDMLGRISAGLDREADIISKYLADHFAIEAATFADENETVLVGALPNTGSQIQIVHQVLFQFKPEVSDQEKKAVLEGGKRMLESIPQVKAVVVGRVAQEDLEFSYGLVTGFESVQDLEAYRSHPEHIRWLQEVYQPVVLKTLVTDIVATE
jgi:hypothetical protein